MARVASITLALVSFLGLAACGEKTDPAMVGIQADRFDNAEWSDPVNLGPLINSSAVDANAGLSTDGHTLYFVSNRTGSLGNNDIWMSQRKCVVCDWEAPVNAGAGINTTQQEGAPTVSDDGRMLFFFSAGRGGFGATDIFVSYRVSTGADGDVWGPPVNLGPDVNSAGAEQGSYYVKQPGEGNAFLYFNRTPAGGSLDVYRVELGNDGMPLGPAVVVPELNDPSGADQKVAVRADGLELLLSSIRTGTFGNFDIWRFTRQNVQDPWSAAEHLGAPINTPDIDSQPALSRDGRTLIFTSIRTGGFGVQDLWMSTRSPAGP